MIKWLIAIIVVIVGGVVLFTYKGTSPSVSPTSTISVTPTETPTATPTTTPPPTNITVTYTDSGYSPKSVTIKVGDSVTFANNSLRNMWTASGVHPTHTAYSGTSLSQHCPDTAEVAFDQCKGEASGVSWTFTFTKAGTWGYHNHSRSSDTGTVIVQ